jgi:hypothetical protein
MYGNSNLFVLASAERDDAPDRIVRRNPDGHTITWHNLDPEAAHSPAQLREYFVSLVTLHAIQAAAVNRHHGALHVNQIVLAQ